MASGLEIFKVSTMTPCEKVTMTQKLTGRDLQDLAVVLAQRAFMRNGSGIA